MENQLDILSDSLKKKLLILHDIEEYNKKQEEAFLNGQVRMEDFDEAAERKEELIQRLSRLDDGFEALYAGLAKQLEGNRDLYATQIKELQAQITEITEMSVSIQAHEARNKKLIENYFSKVRSELGKTRKSSKAAYDYYKNMSGTGYANISTLDSKQ